MIDVEELTLLEIDGVKLMDLDAVLLGVELCDDVGDLDIEGFEEGLGQDEADVDLER